MHICAHLSDNHINEGIVKFYRSALLAMNKKPKGKKMVILKILFLSNWFSLINIKHSETAVHMMLVSFNKESFCLLLLFVLLSEFLYYILGERGDQVSSRSTRADITDISDYFSPSLSLSVYLSPNLSLSIHHSLSLLTISSPHSTFSLIKGNL